MKWPPGWLSESITTWRPTRPQAIALAAGGVALAAAIVTLLAISPWAGGDEEGDFVAVTKTRGSSTTTRRTASPQVTDLPTRTPETTAQPAPLTAAPTAVPQTPIPPAPGPRASMAQLFAWSGGDSQLTDMAMIPGSSDEAFVATQKYADIWRVSLSGTHAPVLVGDLSAYVGGGGGEEGLLSIAFSPNFAGDGRLYAYYTTGGASNLPTVLARFQVVNGVVDSGSQAVILEVPDFASNHNGGRIVFGKDGMLYLSTGDGGGGGDPNENGQDINALLGKVLRLSVSGQQSYAIPADNPFVGANGLDEIWAYGFRNPWRISMDSVTGDFWVGDVGQNAWEEAGRVMRGGNHGWDCYEGFAVFETNGCPAGGFVSPRAAYSHAGGRCSVTGGYVYRGSAIPSLYGWYVYGDYCSGEIWAVSASSDGDPVLLQDTPYSISSFSELPGGELAVLTFDGAVYRLVV